MLPESARHGMRLAKVVADVRAVKVSCEQSLMRRAFGLYSNLAGMYTKKDQFVIPFQFSFKIYLLGPLIFTLRKILEKTCNKVCCLM